MLKQESGIQAIETVKNIHTAYVETGEVFSWGNTKEFITLGLSVAGMGLAGSSIVKSGKSLKAMWQGESVVQSAVVSNATKKVAGGSGSSSGLRYDLQMFAGKSGSNSLGIVNGKTPASRFADKLRGLSNSKRPNTVAVVRTADGKYYVGYNRAGIYNNNIQKVLDYLGNKNLYNRQCAEVNAISRAFNDGADFRC